MYIYKEYIPVIISNIIPILNSIWDNSYFIH